MADLFYAGAYWGPRTESADECANRLARCLDLLGEAHPALSTWFRKGKSKSAASGEPMTTSPEALTELIAGGRNRTDVSGRVINELGFRLSAWNKNSIPVSFSTTCGASPATASVMNVFLLELPDPAGDGAPLYEPKVARAVLEAIVAAWDPQWATFASYSMRNAQPHRNGRPVAGWMTYVSGGRPIAEGESTTFHRGQIVTAAPDPREVTDAQLAQVAALLDAAARGVR
jgi:hypothetical protein